MEKADRQKIILLVLLTAILGYFGYAGVGAFPGVSGLREAAAKLQKERDELQQQVQNAQMMVANLGAIKKERETLEVQLRELARRLPAEHESAQVLRSVETLAGKSGLTVTQVKRRPNRPQELYVEIPMEVAVGGGYHDLLKFSDQLAQLPRLVTLNEVRVDSRRAGAAGTAPAAAPGAGETPGSMRAQVVAVVFQAMPDGGSGGAAKP
jgi:type IV pilus assembly protein PilO